MAESSVAFGDDNTYISFPLLTMRFSISPYVCVCAFMNMGYKRLSLALLLISNGTILRRIRKYCAKPIRIWRLAMGPPLCAKHMRLSGERYCRVNLLLHPASPAIHPEVCMDSAGSARDALLFSQSISPRPFVASMPPTLKATRPTSTPLTPTSTTYFREAFARVYLGDGRPSRLALASPKHRERRGFSPIARGLLSVTKQHIGKIPHPLLRPYLQRCFV